MRLGHPDCNTRKSWTRDLQCRLGVAVCCNLPTSCFFLCILNLVHLHYYISNSCRSQNPKILKTVIGQKVQFLIQSNYRVSIMILVCDVSIYCMVLHVYYYKSIQMETCIFEASVPDFDPPPTQLPSSSLKCPNYQIRQINEYQLAVRLDAPLASYVKCPICQIRKGHCYFLHNVSSNVSLIFINDKLLGGQIHSDWYLVVSAVQVYK